MEDKTLIIYASPKSGSFTEKLLISEVGSLSLYPVFDCFKELPLPCNDCGYCKTKNGCSKSDLDRFFLDFEKAEKIVIAFPVYNSSVPAPLKALLDRFQRFFSARFLRGIKPPMDGKREVTLIITSGSDKDLLEDILKQITPIFTISGCTLKKCITLKSTDKLSKDGILTPKTYNF